MVHVSPHGGTGSGSPGGGGDASWGSVLLASLIVGGGLLGFLWINSTVCVDHDRPSPWTECPCQTSAFSVRDRVVPRNASVWALANRNYQIEDQTSSHPVSIASIERFNIGPREQEIVRLHLEKLEAGHHYIVRFPLGRGISVLSELTVGNDEDLEPPTVTFDELAITVLADAAGREPETQDVNMRAEQSPDTILYRMRIRDSKTSATYMTGLDGARFIGSGPCALPFHFDVGVETCVQLVAIDIAGNESAPAERCATVERKTVAFDANTARCVRGVYHSGNER